MITRSLDVNYGFVFTQASNPRTEKQTMSLEAQSGWIETFFFFFHIKSNQSIDLIAVCYY